jgi:hypothetical protein
MSSHPDSAPAESKDVKVVVVNSKGEQDKPSCAKRTFCLCGCPCVLFYVLLFLAAIVLAGGIYVGTAVTDPPASVTPAPDVPPTMATRLRVLVDPDLESAFEGIEDGNSVFDAMADFSKISLARNASPRAPRSRIEAGGGSPRGPARRAVALLRSRSMTLRTISPTSTETTGSCSTSCFCSITRSTARPRRLAAISTISST